MDIERSGIYSWLPNLALFEHVFSEIVSRFVTFSEPVVIPTISAFNGTQVQKAHVVLLSLFQY
jgi:hypothetical protein